MKKIQRIAKIERGRMYYNYYVALLHIQNNEHFIMPCFFS